MKLSTITMFYALALCAAIGAQVVLSPSTSTEKPRPQVRTKIVSPQVTSRTAQVNHKDWF